MELYPMLFESIYKPKVWGARRLEQLGRHLSEEGPVGESWDVVDDCQVLNGPLSGRTLAECASELGAALVGRRVWDHHGDRFPLLLKILDVAQDVSVQVHPDDAHARLIGDPRGKSECWYVLHAEPGSEIIHGFQRPLDRDTLAQIIRDKELGESLQRIPVKTGDVIFVPAGTVHALCQGLLIYEVQQRSDTTYRIYDWDRPGLDGQLRPLHIEQSLEVLDFSMWPERTALPLPIPDEAGRFYLAACRYFALELWDMSARARWEMDGESFNLITVIEGRMTLRAGEYGEDQVELGYGDTVLVPAEIGLIFMQPDHHCKILRAYVPDLWMDVISPLQNAGVAPEQIIRLSGYGRQNDIAPLLVRR